MPLRNALLVGLVIRTINKGLTLSLANTEHTVSIEMKIILESHLRLLGRVTIVVILTIKETLIVLNQCSLCLNGPVKCSSRMCSLIFRLHGGKINLMKDITAILLTLF